MNVRPILMSAPMILALLREIEQPGTGKTQTRRIVKPQPETVMYPGLRADGKGRVEPLWPMRIDGKMSSHTCPYGATGDLLWVRETWAGDDWAGFLYRADRPNADIRAGDLDDGESTPRRWNPSIHMTRAASRLTLELIDVRVERLQDISTPDAIAEGVEWQGIGQAIPAFARLWKSINGDGSWKENPWVWALAFKPHLVNVNEFLRRAA